MTNIHLPRVLAFLLALPCSVWSATPCSAAELSELESQNLSELQQLTKDFVKAGEGYFSPDGKTIIYQAVPNEYPFYQIYTQQPEPLSKSQLVSTGRGRTTCSYFHPDGKSIIFASSHLDPQLDSTEADERKRQEEDRKSGRRRRYKWDFDQHMDIYRAGTAGEELTRLTATDGYDAECAYSPDGKQIVFCSDRDGDADLYIMDADGSNVRQLTNEPGYDGGPFFSPDGKWVIYRTDRKKAEYLQIHVISSDGKQDVALTNNIGVNWAPYWHPTLPYIIWCGASHADPKARPNYDLWLMPYSIENGQFTGGRPVRITDHPSADVLPVFSPDGKKLMWTSNRGPQGTSQLWITDFTIPEK